MASTPKPVKLAELLQEQQEPFVLEVYLFERGYLRKTSSTNSSSRITSRTSSKKLTRSSSWGNLSCHKVLRSVCNKLGSRHSETTSTKGCENREGKPNGGAETRRSSRESGGTDTFSSASSRTQYDSCSEGEKESKEEAPVSLRNKHDASSLAADATQISESCNMKERKIEWLNGQSSKIHRKQQNPVSVPEDEPPHANASSPLYNKRYKLHTMSREKETSCPSTYSFNKIIEDPNLSSSLWELLFHPPLEKPRASGISEKLEPVRSSINPYPHFAKSKRVLQQKRQLLFDCVREMTENHAKKSKEQQPHNPNGFLGAEEIGKLIYEKLGSWGGKQAGHEANVNVLSELDLLGSREEWDDSYQEKREIGSEIGDAILEEIIKGIVSEE
ncbi:hypothetical protein D8674_032471 [Pyrus ussuriensis x Pyrus communis]|uniref:DUF4378 domain-containing protein n=1 Tax=Pyrus ussuriensis x Pyrus communis TaxID=2448454 RepID=A0A5N5HI59_9ROSA|nr:hypothetical protein D8674_032471 [Pyrus ussuriensis x Pyrus communis]